MKKIICFIFVLLTVKTFSQEILLPDQVFIIKVIEKNANGKSESMPLDELVMKSNQISSGFGLKNGFPAVTYNVTRDAAPNAHIILFSAEGTNGKKDVLKWSGTINGDKVSGKAQRLRNGNPAGEYSFTGNLKKKK